MKNEKLLEEIRKIGCKYGQDEFAGIIAGAYALWLAKQQPTPIDDLRQLLTTIEIDSQVSSFVLQQLENHWNEYYQYLEKSELNDLQEIILTANPRGVNYYTLSISDELKNIVTKLMNIKNTDYVADFGAGIGDFLNYAHNQIPQAQYWGNEINSSIYAIAKIRLEVAGRDNISLIHEDMFSKSTSEAMQFDKAFCLPPFGIRLNDKPNVKRFIYNNYTYVGDNVINCSGEWLFALKMLSCLKETGRAILCLPAGRLVNKIDNFIREFLIKQENIETVIKLPEKMLNYPNIQLALIVFSNKQNKKTNLIDASNWDFKESSSEFSTEKFINLIDSLSNGDLTWESIQFKDTYIDVAKLNEEKPFQIVRVAGDDLIKYGNINPSYYTKEEIKLKESQNLKEVIIDSFRGALINASELKKLQCQDKTSYRYLTSASIQDGMIVDELTCLSEIPEKYKRYNIQLEDLVITKNGDPFKIAVVDVPEGQTIIASGNIFVIRIDKTKADPYYIKAFLESLKGQELLKQATVGTNIPIISINSLREMPIEQLLSKTAKEIGMKYRTQINKIAKIKKDLAKEMDELRKIYDNI